MRALVNEWAFSFKIYSDKNNLCPLYYKFKQYKKMKCKRQYVLPQFPVLILMSHSYFGCLIIIYMHIVTFIDLSNSNMIYLPFTIKGNKGRICVSFHIFLCFSSYSNDMYVAFIILNIKLLLLYE